MINFCGFHDNTKLSEIKEIFTRDTEENLRIRERVANERKRFRKPLFDAFFAKALNGPGYSEPCHVNYCIAAYGDKDQASPGGQWHNSIKSVLKTDDTKKDYLGSFKKIQFEEQKTCADVAEWLLSFSD